MHDPGSLAQLRELAGLSRIAAWRSTSVGGGGKMMNRSYLYLLGGDITIGGGSLGKGSSTWTLA